MIRNILIAVFCVALWVGTPAMTMAGLGSEWTENPVQELTISVSESTLHITGANGEVLNIYNLAGVCVLSFKIDGADKHYELNLPRGCYIVKVGKVVRKISIR
ncbi:MAG: T9SS type A sorting domain-containing protein [Hoylesella enoeca]|uniref:T9SS type A sorting domain-containing protein n=1 Tax=Hoylesella enoeca TaxID=76123 RepID=UPI003FA0CD20